MNIAQGPDSEHSIAHADGMATAAIRFAKDYDEDMSDDARAMLIAAHMITSAINLAGAAIAHGLHQVASAGLE